MKNLARIGTAAALLLLCGCGTVVDLLSRNPKSTPPDHSIIYGGVQCDIHGGSAICRQIGGSEEFKAFSILGFFFAFIDAPLSFVLDTLLLPLTISADVSEPPTRKTPEDR